MLPIHRLRFRVIRSRVQRLFPPGFSQFARTTEERSKRNLVQKCDRRSHGHFVISSFYFFVNQPVHSLFVRCVPQRSLFGSSRHTEQGVVEINIQFVFFNNKLLKGSSHVFVFQGVRQIETIHLFVISLVHI